MSTTTLNGSYGFHRISPTRISGWLSFGNLCFLNAFNVKLEKKKNIHENVKNNYLVYLFLIHVFRLLINRRPKRTRSTDRHHYQQPQQHVIPLIRTAASTERAII